MVGFGYDCHKLVPGNKLILAGIHVESEFATIAHSDGDVVLHALCDALLGAGGLGDIGEHFPDTDPKYKDSDSSIFVLEVLSMLEEKNLEIINIDITVILEKPKLKDYKLKMKENLASLCSIELERVNVKAKTSEKLGFAGRSEGVEAFVICEIKNK
jgi:2-C-methyl-D-erythritol 2,4-cyclodiphosphate synthase